ncbi:MAG TPA: DUF4131 domain-containing protein [Firmicutes bacterium]|nr:DUF4131 domain-containing protein [Bacillota bacterium]
MKRIHTAMISFILLILFVLYISCGCTRSRAEDDYFLTRERETDVITTQSLSGEIDESDVILRTQYLVYDPSCEYVQVIVDNYTDEQVRYGEHWKIDQRLDGEWQPVEFENYGFNDIGLGADAHSGNAYSCRLSMLASELEEGEYRILKEIDNQVYAAEFRVGDSPVTAESPHGFVPLEQLPADYTSVDAADDGAVVVSQDGSITNGDKLAEFFRYAELYYWLGQLRIAQEQADGSLILIDVIRSRPERIDIVTDTTRGADGEITSRYFRFFHVKDGRIYAANFVDFEYDPEPFLIIDCPNETETLELLSDYHTGIFARDFTIYSWSPDGNIRAAYRPKADYPIILSFNNGDDGGRCKVRGGEVDGSELVDIRWRDANTCIAIVELSGGGYYYEYIQIDADDLDSTAVESFAYSSERYTLEDGEVVIPE